MPRIIFDLPQVGSVTFNLDSFCAVINRYLATSSISCIVIVTTVTILEIREITIMI